jgi:hypothetical protein
MTVGGGDSYRRRMREPTFTVSPATRTEEGSVRRGGINPRTARPDGTRHHPTRLPRWAGGALAVTLLTSLLVVVPLVLSDPAGADGFNFLCEAPGGPPGESEFEQMANGLAIKILADQAVWVFQGTVPAGIPVSVPGAVTDAVTGETSFTLPIAPHPGNSQRIDFIPSSVPGAAGNEITFGFSFRNKAGQRGDDLSMLQLFTENYGLPLEPGNDINVAGVDINFETNEIMRNLQGFRGSFAAFYTYRLRGNDNNLAVGTFKIDSMRPGARLPDEGTLSLSIRKPPDATASFVAFGQRTIHHAFDDGHANQPGVGYGIDLTRATLLPDDILFDPFLSMHLDWSAAPRSLAIGVGSLCPDKGHLAWNHDGLPNPAAASVDIDVKYGIEEGLPILRDDGAGPHPINANIMDVNGAIDGLPSQMDVILLRDAMSFTRSPDVAPDLELKRLAMADDDPADLDDLPMFATAQVTDLPRHLLVTTEDAADGSFARADFTSWNLQCPGEPVPPGPAAPDDVRRLDLPQTLPGFPVGCVRHSLTPVPSAEAVIQNWLPEDLNAQAASAGLTPPPLDANQFAYVATRDTHALSSEPLRAFGGRIKGVQRVAVDLTAAAADEDHLRTYVERAPVAGADDSLRVTTDIDGRTSSDELRNAGARLQASALIPDLPDRIRLDVSRTPDTPLALTWRADAPLAVSDGSFDVQGPGPLVLLAHGAFETGSAGSGLPPTATLVVNDDPSGAGGAVHWSKAPGVTDTFPTPPAPAFDTTTLTRVHAGAQLSTAADRAAGVATRLHADIKVPQPVDVTWSTPGGGALDALDARFCDPAAPDECAATRLDATVVKSPQPSVTGSALLAAPPVPAPDANTAAAVQPFTEYRPNASGFRGANLGPDLFGADVVVNGLAHVAYHADPLDVAVELANPDPQAFVVNLLNATPVTASDGSAHTDILFADATIDRLPSDVRVRLQGADAPADQPLLWVNAEDVTIDDIHDVDWTPDPAGSRPTVRGVVRFGDADLLRTERPATGRPTPRPINTRGVDVWADYSLDQRLLAVDAAAFLDVPRHVAVWRPDLRRCDPSSADARTCQTRPLYEPDDVEKVTVQLRTTSDAIGELNVRGDIKGDGLNWLVIAKVGRVPGTLTGDLTITQNTRLPWLQIDVHLNGSAPLDTLSAQIVDNNKPVEYRFDEDEPGQPQCHEKDSDFCTAKYAVDLTNVPADLEVNARVEGDGEARLTPKPEEPPDPDDPHVNDDGIAFVHAVLDLGGAANRIFIQGTGGGEKGFIGSMRAETHAEAPAPVSGFINARVDHVTVHLHPNDDSSKDPFDIFVVEKAGIVGALSGNQTAGRISQIITFPLDIVLGILADIFLGGTFRSHFDVDMDLPLYIEFDHIDALRFGQNATTFSVDERHTDFEGAPAQFGTLQRLMPDEGDLQFDGAFFHSRDVNINSDATLEGFDIGNTDHGLQPVGLFRHEACLTQEEEHVCYFLANNLVGLDQVSAAHGRGVGFNSADILVDFFFDPDNRHEMDEANDGFVEPGVDYYKKVADLTDPLTDAAFFLPDLGSAAIRSDSFTTASYCCNTTTFVTIPLDENPPPPPFPVEYGPICDLSNVDAVNTTPPARGTDGTEFVVVTAQSQTVPPNATRALCRATKRVLEAHFPRQFLNGPIGPVRWSIVLPTAPGLEDGGACRAEAARCDFTTVVTPRADGSVEVATTTTLFEGGVDGASLDTTSSTVFTPVGVEQDGLAIEACCPQPNVVEVDGAPIAGVTRALVDASGHPGFHRLDDAKVQDFGAVDLSGSVSDAGVATLDPCVVAPTFGCAPLPDGHTAQWLFGDGVLSAKLGGQVSPVGHAYFHSPHSDELLGVLVHYDETGEVVDKAYFRLSF